MSRAPDAGRLALAGGLSGITGVALLSISFAINSPPPVGASSAALLEFGRVHYATILWGAWMQAIGPVLIVLFAFTLVHLADAARSVAGWMTFFGATVLMTVSLIEITFYMSALHPNPAVLPPISLELIAAVQHLYFMVAAPALFVPLGLILVRTDVLPRAFGYLALLVGGVFAVVGLVFLLELTLPTAVTALGGVQALWWLAAAIALIDRTRRPSSAERESFHDKKLYHQIHPLKLATDIAAAIVAFCFLWRHEIEPAIVTGLVPPVVASFMLIRWIGDWNRLRASPLGQYV